jgi:hypothetical protein
MGNTHSSDHTPRMVRKRSAIYTINLGCQSTPSIFTSTRSSTPLRQKPSSPDLHEKAGPLIYSMGHTPSRHSPAHPSSLRVVRKKICAKNYGCRSPSLDSEPSSDGSTLLHEKSTHECHGKRSCDQPHQITRCDGRHDGHGTPLVYSPQRVDPDRPRDDETIAYQAFLNVYPEYQLTWILDNLRRTDFARLDRNGETYVDFMGGALYPESLIHVHTDFLSRSILGNTHSVSKRCEY